MQEVSARRKETRGACRERTVRTKSRPSTLPAYRGCQKQAVRPARLAGLTGPKRRRTRGSFHRSNTAQGTCAMHGTSTARSRIPVLPSLFGSSSPAAASSSTFSGRDATRRAPRPSRFASRHVAVAVAAARPSFNSLSLPPSMTRSCTAGTHHVGE